MEEEFRKIDTNKGGQILFSEFIEWALVKNLDLEDDIDCEEWRVIVPAVRPNDGLEHNCSHLANGIHAYL